MLRFAASITMLFRELPPVERFAAAGAAGFGAVEMQNPYVLPAAELARARAASGLPVVLINTPSGDHAAGDRGFGAVPGREADFEKGFATALDYAGALGAGMIHVLAGVPGGSTDPAEADRVFLANLKRALAASRSSGVRLLLEPLNPYDFPGYHLSTFAHARRLIETVGDERLGLQLDLFHRQRSEGDLDGGLRGYIDIARHIQIAGPPHRSEPDTGEVNFPYLLGVIEELGYKGWIGAEYNPVGDTVAGLGWLSRWTGGRPDEGA